MVSLQALGNVHVVGVDHPRHAFAHRAQVMDLRIDECPRIDCPAAARWVPSRDDELGMGLHHVVLLHERLFGELPVHGETTGVPPFDPQRLDLPGVKDGGERLDALSQRWSIVVQVDPGAPAPDLAPHGREVDVRRLQVVLGKRLLPRDEGVLAVRAVTPPVERADEPALARTSTLDDLDATMAAGVLEGGRSPAFGAHHDDGLIQDLVLGEVAGLRDLLEPARHLPDPRPQELRLHLEEVRVEIALLAGPVGELDRVGHRRCRRSPVHDRHSGPFPSRSAFE